MYVCLCRALNERDVDDARSSGATKPAEVFRHYGVAPQCGRCLSSMRGMLGAEGACGERRHLTDGQTPQAAIRHGAR